MQHQTATVAAQTAAGGPSPAHPPAQSHDIPAHHGTGLRHEAKKPQELVDLEQIAAKKRAGCDCGCINDWQAADILHFRTQMAAKNERERLQALLEYVSQCHKTSRGYNEYSLEFKGKTYRVCRAAFITIMGTSSYKLTRAIELFHKQLGPPIHGNVAKREALEHELMTAWLAEFRDTECEHRGGYW
jgi:hypothetical protein